MIIKTAGALMLVLALAGCADLKAVVNAGKIVAGATVPGKDAIVAANGFDAIEATATNILKICTPASRPAACNDTNLRTMNGAILAGRPIRNSLEATLSADSSANVSQSAYSKLEAIITTLTQAVTAYQSAT